ncbi:MAG: ABC transporter ATP-binding protein [Betaproteobacteria bacterium]
MNEHANGVTLCAHGLTRKFGAHTAVNNISIELKRGEVLGFLGPNGAGKTTTMQMLTGNLAPSSGAISICGVDLLDRPVAAKAKLGYLPEVPPLYRELTVDEYLLLAARLHRVERGARRAAVARVKARCGLTDVGGKLIGSLSKGYQQRVGIAQAIIHEPDVVILDEPTAGLDPNQIRHIRDLIRELGGERSVILSTHILPEVEAVCDQVQILHHGNLVYSDTISALERFHSGRTLLVGLRSPPPENELAAINGVVSVEKDTDTLFRIQWSANTDPTDELVMRAVSAKWGLYQLSPAQTRLEDVFVHLTRSEGPAE